MGLYRSTDDLVFRIQTPLTLVTNVAGGNVTYTIDNTPANIAVIIIKPDGTPLYAGYLDGLPSVGVSYSFLAFGYAPMTEVRVNASACVSGEWSLYATNVTNASYPSIDTQQWGGIADVLATGATDATTVKDLTKADAAGDLAAIKAVTAALPNAGALTGIAADAATAAGAAADTTAIRAVTDLLPDAGALTGIAADAATAAGAAADTTAIRAVTDLLPDAGALTGIVTGATAAEAVDTLTKANGDGDLVVIRSLAGDASSRAAGAQSAANTAAGNAANAANYGVTISADMLLVKNRIGDPGVGNTLVSLLATLQASATAAAAALAALGASIDDVQLFLASVPGMSAGYVEATGLLTIRVATSSEWLFAIDGEPSRIRFKISATQFDSNDFAGDLEAFLSAVAGYSGVKALTLGDACFTLTAVPCVDVIDVTDLIVDGMGATGTLTQTATGTNVATAWIQYYADAACTTPHNGAMGTSAGKARLFAAP